MIASSSDQKTESTLGMRLPVEPYPVLNLNDSHDAIYINDNREEGHQRGAIAQQDLSAVAKFEIFESSSDDELSQGAYESAAQSYQKKVDRQKRLNGELDDEEVEEDDEEENLLILDSQEERERKLKDKQRRMERKRLEKKRKQREHEREERKMALLKTFKQEISPYCQGGKDEFQEDILNFKDSDRESLLSYL